MTTASLRNTSARTVKADAVVVGFIGTGESITLVTGASHAGSVVDAWKGDLAATLLDLGASAKPGDVCRLPSAGAAKAPLLLAVGLGAGEDISAETLRRASGAAARSVGGKATVAVALPSSTDEQVRAVVEGSLLGAYSYDDYLSKKQPPVENVVVLTDQARSKSANAAAEEASCLASAVNYTRDLINRPPNDLYPESFAAEVSRRAKKSAVKVSVTADKELAAQGYGGILGVGKASARPPRLVTLAYQPSRPLAHLAFVGKGITFDSGGLSIKPSPSMATMKSDMSGAAAVAAATFAIAELGLPVRVSSYLCLAENMPAGNAMRPGDVLTMYGGKTVEVLNTDAEGRLVLADGIVTANAVEPDLIVDVATLTGACVVALGNRVSGVFSNDPDLLQEVPKLAAGVGELMWPMPIPDEMVDKLRTTKIADLSQHNPELWGGALFAAAFLREFVGEGISWAHLDIAGPAFNSDPPHGYTPRGGTGAAVRTLVAVAKSRCS